MHERNVATEELNWGEEIESKRVKEEKGEEKDREDKERNR